MSFAIRAANDKLDLTLSALMAAIALTVSALLIADVNIFFRDARDHTEKPAIARLAETSEGVRRRPQDLPVWDTARLSEPLYLKDFVFTDRDSSAKLAFLDDSTIELGENTLIEVQQIEENSVLNVIKGSLKARTGPGAAEILIRVNGQKELIRSGAGAALELNVQQGKPAELKVLAGKAEIGTSRVAVVANQAASITSDALPPTITALPVNLTAPAHGALLKDPPASGVQLSWQGTAEAFHLEIATDQGFRHVVRQEQIRSQSFATGALPAGTYYWRVASGSQEVSETRRFTVEIARGPELYFPASGQMIADLSPALSWERVAKAKKYEVQVASDAAFSSLVWTNQTSSPQARAGALQNGVFFWRVRDSAEDVWSDVARFQIEARAVEPVSTPKMKLNAPILPKRFDIKLPLNAPRKPRRYWLMDLLESTAYAEEADTGKVLHWPTVEGAQGYQVEIAAEPTFRSPLISERVRTPEWTVHDLAPGSYFLRVAGIDDTGSFGSFSEPSEVQVRSTEAVKPSLRSPTLLAPVDGEKVTLAAKVPVVSFSWRPVSGAATYTFQVATDEDFTNVVHEKRTRGRDLNVELKAHGYYWRMRSHRTANEPGEWGKPSRFEVIHALIASPAPAVEARPIEPLPAAPPPVYQPVKLSPEHGRLTVTLNPSRYHYESTDGDPKTKIDAKLFNSTGIDGSVKLRPGLAFEAAFRRTSMVLFKDGTQHMPPGQESLKISPFSAQAAARWRLGYDLTPNQPFLDLALGYQLRTLARFQREADQTIAATTERLQGPTLGLAGGIRFSETLATKLAAQGFAHGYRAYALVNQDFDHPGFGVSFGIEYAKESTEVEVLVQTLILGAGYDY